MLHRQFFVYFLFIPLIVSVSYLEILRFLSVTEIYIKMSEILIIWLSALVSQMALYLIFILLPKSTHILSIWCFIHKIHDHVVIVLLSAPLLYLYTFRRFFDYINAFHPTVLIEILFIHLMSLHGNCVGRLKKTERFFRSNWSVCNTVL